jgi:RimJ/RimL family protein N-acetyltransferase
MLPSTLSTELRTERLLLRRWRAEDREPFAAMNADSRVMRHFPALLSREESDGRFDRIQAHWNEQGFGLWAVEVVGTAPFIGLIGLCHAPFEASFTPCVEIGWRLAAEHWGQGLATEGARAALQCGFGRLGLSEVLSFTVPENHASRRVMEKLGMTHDPADDFDHPLLAEGHPLRRHVLYRISRRRFAAERSQVERSGGERGVSQDGATPGPATNGRFDRP